MRTSTAGLALLLLLARPIAAQQQPQDPKRMAAASELVELLKLEQSQVPDMSGASGLTADNPMADEMAKLMMEFYKEFAPWEKVRPEIVRIYADSYSESELREIIAFYQTPVGKKVIDNTPAMTKAMTQVTQKLLLPHVPELQARMMARLTGGGL